MLLGAFTLASGTSHLMEVWALLHPTHWLTNGIEAIAVVMDLLTVLLAALLLLNVILDFNKDSEEVATSGESALPWEAKTLSATQTHQLDAELEQQVNEQIAALQRNHPQFKSELHGRVRWLEELGLLQSLCALISEADDFQSALCVALRLVCEVTNWDYGEAWLPSADNSVLECTPAWYSKTTRLEQFRLSREKLILPRNTALPGRVWTSRRPEWIEDISALADTSVVRPQARVAGLKAAFGVPILIGDRVLAVLAFFITQSRAEDEQLVELVSAVATQLGLVIQRKQLEEELRQEKDFSKTLIETSSAFFVAVDAKGRTIMMNQAFLEAVGYTLDEVLGADYLLTFARACDRKSLYKTFKQLVKSRQPILKENYVLTKDGRELLVEWRGKPIFRHSQAESGNEDELDFCFGVGIDITERKQLEQELLHSEERYRAVVEDQSELICRFVADGTITFVNDAYCRYFGKTREELLESNLFQMIPDEYREKTQRHIASLRWKNPVATREYQMLMPNGETHWLQWTDRAIIDPGGNLSQFSSKQAEGDQIVEFQSVGRDITERRRSEQETARLASIALLSPNPIVETDLVGNVRYLNPEAMRLLPDLQELGCEHQFLAGVPLMATELQRKGSIKREIKIGEIYYEQVLHYLEEIQCFRIYAFDISDRKQAEKQLIHNAFYDQLTGLPNRALFMDRLRQAVQRATQSRRTNLRGQPYRFAVLFVNLNRFKLVNDSLGNEVGDQLLQNFAERLQTCLRPTDTVARLGADEFTILLEGIQDVNDATRVAESIHQTLSSPFYLNEREVFMTLSIGIALNTSHNEQPEDLLRNADLAMYRARSQGKAYYEVFDAAMHEIAVERLQIETDLRRAIEREEFRVYYQPIVSLSTGKIIGFEALLRWQHPLRGLVSPNDFISTAEETGLITPIGWWTLREACQQLKEWQEQFPSSRPLTMNVNLSCKQFTQPDLLEHIDNILQEAQLAVGSLKLEITESVVMENPDWVKDVLLELKKRKIPLCIDDFGTGYSSLSRLHHFPISTLKIDRSFISRIGALGENSEIVQAIVTLAQTLSMDVVAEGIELSEQVSPLLALQCEYGQGYFFSKPVDSEAARALLLAEWEQRNGKVGND
jgi:diguanylate cyclase (GGDEF)-like protein/PAS domain S-box-containing protein